MSRIACMSQPEKQSCLCHLNIYFFILISWFCLCAQAVQISFKMCKNLLPSVTMLCICVCVCISMRQNRRAACMLWEIRSVLRCTADWHLWAYELRGLDIDSIMLVMGAYCSECLWITPQFPPKLTPVCFRHALWSALLQVKTFKAHPPHAATLHIACRLPERNKMAAIWLAQSEFEGNATHQLVCKITKLKKCV